MQTLRARLFGLCIFVLAAAASMAPARAGTVTYQGPVSGTTSWSTPSNWNPGVPTAADDVVFPALTLAGNLTVNLDGSRACRSLTVSFIANTFSFTIASGVGGAGGTLTVGDGAAPGSISSSLNTTFSCGFALSSTLTLAPPAGGTITLSGIISEATQAGNSGLTKIGMGVVILSGANTYRGLTTVSEGVLTVANSLALGSPQSGTTVSAGAALELQSDLEAEPVTLNGNGSSLNGHNTGALRNVSNNNTYTGVLTLSTSSTIGVDSGSTLTIGSKQGVGGTGSLVDSGGVGSSANLVKELTGTLILSSSNTYRGTTTVNQGVLTIQNSQALGSTAAGTTVRDGAQLQLQGGLTVSNEALMLSGIGVGGSGALLNTSGDNVWNGPITLNSLAGFSPPTTPPTSVAISVANAANSLSLGGAVGETGGSFGVTKVGAGSLEFSQANTYSGTTTIAAGVLRIQNGGALGAAAGDTIVNSGGALELDSSKLTAGSSLDVFNEKLILNGSGNGGTGATRAISGSSTWSGPILLSSDSTIGTDAASQLTLTGVISDNAAAASSLSKTGTGTLIFPASTANTYRGTTIINDGILNIRNPESLGPPASGGTRVSSGATLQVQGSITVADEPLTLNGPGVSEAGLINSKGALMSLGGTNTWSRPITLGSDSSINVEGAADDSLTLAGAIGQGAAAAGITKFGSRRLVLQGDGTYSGITFVNEGTLAVNGSQPNSAVTVNEATLTGTGTVGPCTAGPGSHIAPPPGQLKVQGNYIGTDASGAAAGAGKVSMHDISITGAAPNQSSQLVVKGAVTLQNTGLSVVFGSGFTPAIGDKFTLIDNDGTDAIAGTYAGLAEGAVFSVGTRGLSITYAGGDGNDVVVTGVSRAPVVSSGPTATPSVAGVGQTVQFSVTADDPDNGGLIFNWMYGDGLIGNGATSTHAYSAAGTYTATVTISTNSPVPTSVTASVTVVVNAPLVGKGSDLDGDGFSDEFETLFGSTTTNAASTPTGQPATAVSALTITKASIKLNFKKTGKDSIDLQGTLSLPAGFTPLSQKVLIEVGGVGKTLTLDAKGTGKLGNDSIKILMKVKKGQTAIPPAKYIVKFAKGSFAQALADEGLTNADLKNQPRTVSVTVIAGGTILQKQQTLSYTSKTKSGMGLAK